MAQISSGIGLVSGINYQSLITQLVAIDAAPENIVNSQINQTQQQQQAFTALSTELSSLGTIGNNLALPQTFAAADANSSNPGVLTATAAEGAAVGTYQFQVAQLVSTQQTISTGFANASTSLVGAGTLTIEQGGGQATSQTSLASLNGGAGAQRGQFRITDRSGNSAIIDTSNAVTLDDVVKSINSAANISVKATLTNQGIVLTDTSGQTKNDLTVTDIAGGSAAASLGIAGDAGAGNTVLTGSAINYLGVNTQLGGINDGLGINVASSGSDFQVNLSDGTNFKVSLKSAQTIGDVLNAINTAGGSKIKATIATNGQGLEIQDLSGGSSQPFSIAAVGGSQAAQDLGIAGTGTGGAINGSAVIAGLDSVLVSSLKGGSGLPLGQISITDRSGNTGTIDLSGAKSVSDILNDINSNTLGVEVTASINTAGTGIQLTDSSGGTGNLVVSDVNSTTAAALGIAGTFTTATPTDVGSNLQRQYVSQNTLLSSLDGGQGVGLGTFAITNSVGATTNIDLTQGSVNSVGDVINAINNAHGGVTASINANGNGILLTDTAGGAGKLSVKDTSGSSAADLNLAGTASAKTIDGAFQKTINVTAGDTLASLQTKINNLGFGVTAQIVNDGSATNPFRLSLTSANSGAAGQVIIDGGTTNLNPTTLVQGQDAAVFFGGGNSTQPLLITSSTNQITNVVRGVTLSLQAASSTPVTLSVTSDPSGISTNLSNFVSQFNTLITQIGSLTAFNTTTNQGGLLLGNPTTDQIQSVLFSAINTAVNGAGQYKTLADIGITIGSDAQLTFDSNTFSAAFATNPQAVQNLFSQTGTGLGNVIANAVTQLDDPISGLVTDEVNTLGTRITNYQSYSAELATLVAQKQTLLQQQFANLESNLATLQSQSAVLGGLSSSLANVGSSSSSTGSGSSSSSTSNNGVSNGLSSASTSNSTGG